MEKRCNKKVNSWFLWAAQTDDFLLEIGFLAVGFHFKYCFQSFSFRLVALEHFMDTHPMMAKDGLMTML